MLLDNIRQNDDYIQNISNPYDSGQVNDEGDTAIANVSYVVPQTGLKILLNISSTKN